MPRSPSRDLVDRFIGNRGYFHHADGLRRWKNGVAFAALGLTMGWVAVELAMPPRAAVVHSHGELAGPHAAFDANCEACHAAHTASDFLSNPASVFTTQTRWRDLTCTKCHAGPAHHAAAKDGGAFHNQCSNCHHDHQGRGQSLVRISDSHCTKCHADLPSAHQTGHPIFAKTITGFGTDHPEFRPLEAGRAETARRLKFSHALHLTPGLVYQENDQHPWTAAELGKQFGPAAKQRFASLDAANDRPVQLTCAACHQLDAGYANPDDPDRRRFDLFANAIRGDAKKSILPVRAEGAYYQPINFDMHCKVCHPLRTPAAVSGGNVVEPFAAPHRRQPEELHGILRGEYAARLAAGKHRAMAMPLGPGGRLDAQRSPDVAAFGKEVDRLTDSAMKAFLLNLEPAPESASAAAELGSGGFACGKCHYSTEPGKPGIAPLPNKTVWFEHAKFNHASHRGLTCLECHPGTSGMINEREPALISGIKSCQACHAAVGKSIDLPNGLQAAAAGVRHSCTDCHRYHNGDRPLQGLGSPHRDPVRPLNLDEWFKGKENPMHGIEGSIKP